MRTRNFFLRLRKLAIARALTSASLLAQAPADPAEELFVEKCASCHTVGDGTLVGPDLKDAQKRRHRAWLERFVTTPGAMLASDPDARNLAVEFGDMPMPDLGLSAKEGASLVDLITRCSSRPCDLSEARRRPARLPDTGLRRLALVPALAAASVLAQAPAPAPETAAAATPVSASAQPGPAEDLFARKCASCHTVGKGVRVGPDLKDAHKRRSRAWLERFVTAPSAMLDSDPDARNLVTEFKGVRMPDLGLADRDVASLVDLIARCSTQPCDLAGKFTPVSSATAQDIARGHGFYNGALALKGGGAPCMSCHTVRGAAGMVGGGTMAKDLTNVFARLGDEGLDRALASPAFPLMNKVFVDHPLDPSEVFALRAFLFDANRAAAPIAEDTLSIGLFSGIAALAALVLLNALWWRRLKGVRKPLVERGAAR